MKKYPTLIITFKNGKPKSWIKITPVPFIPPITRKRRKNEK
jgi:hypothetical protein